MDTPSIAELLTRIEQLATRLQRVEDRHRAEDAQIEKAVEGVQALAQSVRP